jgi:acyl-CoA thioester hydrolase
MSTIQKIRYSDCDPQGIVFNGNYAKYWDDAMTDWFDDLEDAGVSLTHLGVDVVTARLEIDFRTSATMRDRLETSIDVEKTGNKSLTLGVVTRKQSDDSVVAEGRIICVFVDPSNFKPVALPDSFREAIAPSA